MTALLQERALRRWLWRLLVLVPLVLFLGVTALFLNKLIKGGDPSALPSALIGRPAPPTPRWSGRCRSARRSRSCARSP